MVSIAIFCHSEPVHKQKPPVGDLAPLILTIHRYSQLDGGRSLLSHARQPDFAPRNMMMLPIMDNMTPAVVK
jgi:hypothetical protein